MTKDEFLEGWTLLVAQPWGLRYARQDTKMDRKLSRSQADLYYNEFAGVEGADWLRACQQYAKGTHWPSIDELRVTLRARPNSPPAVSPVAGKMPLAAFGDDLFQAIQLAAQVQQLDKQLADAVWLNKSQRARLAKERKKLAEQARHAASSTNISDEDAAALVRQYPWLLAEQEEA